MRNCNYSASPSGVATTPRRLMGTPPVAAVVWVWLAATVGTATAGPSDLDPTFGNEGRVFTTAVADVQAVTTTPDGGVLLVGNDVDFLGDWGTNVLLVRLTRDGRLNPGFGQGGVASLDSGGYDDGAAAVAPLSNGGWVLAGTACCHPGENNIAAYSLRSDGLLDPAFGGTGYSLVDLGGGEEGTALAVADDGAVFLAGDTRTATESNVFDEPIGIFVAKFLPSGSLDTAFGDGGHILLPTSEGIGHAVALLRDPTAALILVHSADKSPAAWTCTLTRLTTDGRLDLTFGVAGSVTVPWPSHAGGKCRSAALQHDGSIVLAGAVPYAGDPLAPDDAWVARLAPTGALDASFGSGGHAVFALSAGADSFIRAAADPAGGIVLIGQSASPHDPTSQQLVMRLDASGRPDESFAVDGVKVLDTNAPDGGIDVLVDLALAADGGIYVAGTVPGFYPYKDGPAMGMAARLFGRSSEPALIFPGGLNYAVDEESGAVEVVIHRSGLATVAASVNFSTESVTDGAGTGATAGEDFIAAQGILSWGVGDTSDRVIEITLLDDEVSEPRPESFGLRLSDAVGTDLGADYVLIAIAPSDTGDSGGSSGGGGSGGSSGGGGSGGSSGGGGQSDLFLFALTVALWLASGQRKPRDASITSPTASMADLA